MAVPRNHIALVPRRLDVPRPPPRDPHPDRAALLHQSEEVDLFFGELKKIRGGTGR